MKDSTILRIVGFYVRHSANVMKLTKNSWPLEILRQMHIFCQYCGRKLPTITWSLEIFVETTGSYICHQTMYYTLQMFTGIYRDSAGKSECGDFKFMGIACIPTIPAKIVKKFEKKS